jgi:prepilin-type N-terminal cleavage/methylation domain-containing protein
MFLTSDKLRTRSGRRGRMRAFTLAELSIVVLIMSILAVVSVPRYVNALWQYQADAAARRVKVDLEFLRRRALQASASRSVTFNVSDHSYTMLGVTDMNRAGRSDYIVSLKVNPYNSKLTSADCGGDATLTFNGYGKPDTSATIVVTSGAFTKTITVEGVAGSVSIQ